MMFSPYIVFLAATAGLLATVGAVPAAADTTPCTTSEAMYSPKPKPPPTTQKPVIPETCSTNLLPDAVLPAAANRPGMPAVHQGVEHDGAVFDGLLPDDADDYCAEGRVPNVRPLPHPYGVDHVHDGLPRRAYHY
ncbi:hypothetical protein DL764_006585 [Monosporascus ibericus]|uniref:Secreted protein n=1 Tax=Monosporascus ibericus TaxID=155417 RepID=A0A4Q4T4F2_9PEZI|nr:hypothetical protein DL764_006585 [Monosporascus ibericus]